VTDKIIEFDRVVAGYSPSLTILNETTLDARGGEITLLIGPNGAGKSTVLKTLSGLLRAREGRIVFDGEDVCRCSAAELLSRGIVHVAQERSLFPLMTVWDNLLMGGHILRDRALVRSRAEAMAAGAAATPVRRRDRARRLLGRRAIAGRDP